MARERALPAATVNFLSMSWLMFVVFFLFRKWYPLELLAAQGPILPEDLLASVIKIYNDGLSVCLAVAAGALSALGAGWMALAPFRLELDGRRNLALSFALGVGALSFMAFFVGVTVGYNRAGYAVLISLSGVFMAAGALHAKRLAKGVSFAGKTGWLGIVFVVSLCLVSLFLSSKALKPAVFYDAVTYHLGVPNYYIQEGGIRYIPYDSFSNFPFMAEMLYTLGMFLGGLKVAQLASVAVFIACVLTVYEFSRAFVKDINPALPALLLLVTPAFMESSILYSCDLYLAYFTLMATYCFFAWVEGGKDAYLVLAGVFTGICLGTKNIALVSVLPPLTAGVFYTAAMRKRRGFAGAAGLAAMFAAIAFAVYLPWMIKNVVNTGNPFYPGFYGVFGGSDMDKTRYSVIVSMANHPGIAEAAKGLLLHPWGLFMSGPSKTVAVYGAAPYLGPVLLAFPPMLILAKGVPGGVKALLAFSCAMFIIWAATFPITRYLYPAVVLFTVVAGYALTRAADGMPRILKHIFVACTVFFILSNIVLGFFLVDGWTKAHGFEHLRETDGQYLTRQAPVDRASLSSYPVYSYINDNLDKTARVLIIGDAEHLYINRRHLYTYLSATTPYGAFTGKPRGFGAVNESLKRDGITHIVYNPAEMRRLQDCGAIALGREYTPSVEGFLKSSYVKGLLVSKVAGQPVYLFELK